MSTDCKQSKSLTLTYKFKIGKITISEKSKVTGNNVTEDYGTDKKRYKFEMFIAIGHVLIQFFQHFPPPKLPKNL